MDKQEFIVLSLIKTFSGKIVTEYPGKGQKAISGGGKPVNLFPIGKLERKNNDKNTYENYTFDFD